MINIFSYFQKWIYKKYCYNDFVFSTRYKSDKFQILDKKGKWHDVSTFKWTHEWEKELFEKAIKLGEYKIN